MTTDRGVLIRQTALEIGAEALLERALAAEAERDQLKAEVKRYRAALEAVAVSKFATEPHRIARDALGEEVTS